MIESGIKKTIKNFGKRKHQLEREIKKTETKIKRLQGLEKSDRQKWAKRFSEYRTKVRELTEVKKAGTKKFKSLTDKIKRFDADTDPITLARDTHREMIATERSKLNRLQVELAMLKEQETSEINNMDQIVGQVFELNENVVQASQARETCLKNHVFPRLFDEKGGMRRQVSFISSNGLRRVVAMVNSMTIIKADLADEAQVLIGQFFERFMGGKKAETMDEGIGSLYELTRELLVSKTSFKVGPRLYQFISMKLSADTFPELVQAQDLLKQSIQSEKSNSYIRIFERKSRTDRWEPVSQS